MAIIKPYRPPFFQHHATGLKTREIAMSSRQNAEKLIAFMIWWNNDHSKGFVCHK